MAFTRVPVCCALTALAVAGLVCAAAFVPAPIGASWAQDNDPVVARANGVDLHESDIAFAEEEVGANMPNLSLIHI